MGLNSFEVGIREIIWWAGLSGLHILPKTKQTFPQIT